MSNITVVGAGYVGLGTAALLAYLGHSVRVLDVDAHKITQLEAGNLPLYEPGLGELLAQVSRRLRWTTSYAEATAPVDFIFVCVGTPSLPGGQPDLAPLEGAIHSVLAHLEDQSLEMQPPTLVLKSTVPIGTGARLCQLFENHAARTRTRACPVVSNPEFLREGSALGDSLYPDRIVLGGHTVPGAKSSRAPTPNNEALEGCRLCTSPSFPRASCRPRTCPVQNTSYRRRWSEPPTPAPR